MTKKVRALIVGGSVAGLLGLGAGFGPMAVGAPCPGPDPDREHVEGDSGVYTRGQVGIDGTVGVEGEAPDGSGGYIEASGGLTPEPHGHIVAAGSDGTGYAVQDGGAGECGGE